MDVTLVNSSTEKSSGWSGDGVVSLMVLPLYKHRNEACEVFKRLL